jgi:hypothetical protein
MNKLFAIVTAIVLLTSFAYAATYQAALIVS